MFRTVLLERPDLSRGCKAVHHRHMDIHKDHIIISRPGLLHFPDSLQTVLHAVHQNTAVPQQFLHNFPVQFIIRDFHCP